MTKFEQYEKQFYAMLKSEDLTIHHKLNGLDFLITEMTKLIENNEMSMDELSRSLELTYVYENFIFESKIENLNKRREWLLSLKILQDDYLDALSKAKSDMEKQEYIIGLKALHKLSNDIDGDIEKLDEELNKLQVEYFTFKESKY